jgi:Sec-independent protein translocase protein TatA
MLDLSPEKLMMLLAVGLMVLGPNRLPMAARSLARGLARARQLTASIGDPVLNEVAADLRQAVRTQTSTPAPAHRPTPDDAAHLP